MLDSPSTTSAGREPHSYPVMPAFLASSGFLSGAYRAASSPTPARPTKFVPPTDRPPVWAGAARQLSWG